MPFGGTGINFTSSGYVFRVVGFRGDYPGQKFVPGSQYLMNGVGVRNLHNDIIYETRVYGRGVGKGAYAASSRMTARRPWKKERVRSLECHQQLCTKACKQ